MNARRPSRFFGIFPPTPYGRFRSNWNGQVGARGVKTT
jgi:hypothetical protein